MPRSSRIGPFRILRLIKQGGQGSVYLGFDDRLHRRVAIKIYQLPRSKNNRQDLLREARLVASIQSPKVVQIHDLIVANEHVALIMEYIPGCDLEELLNAGGLSLASILAICTDIAGALAAARQQRIVHGDLKASNILITEQGRVKLTDFGIARDDRELHSTAGGAASLSCISPEQYLGRPLDVRSDLFALGCLLYRMLTGRAPFVSEGVLDDEALLGRAPRPIEDLRPESLYVPAALSELLASLLQKAPDDRPENTHQVRNVLRAIARDIPLSVGNMLLREAQPCFRKESPEDFPPNIPSDLTRNGRSGLVHSRVREWLGNLTGHSAIGLGLVSLVTCGLFGSMLVAAFLPGPTRVTIEAPSLQLAAAAVLPVELSSDWLVEQISQVLNSQLANVHIVDPRAAADKTFYSQGIAQPGAGGSKLRVRTRLQCVGELCLLALVLENEGKRSTRQQMIFTSMGISQWSDSVQNAMHDLLSQNE